MFHPLTAVRSAPTGLTAGTPTKTSVPLSGTPVPPRVGDRLPGDRLQRRRHQAGHPAAGHHRARQTVTGLTPARRTSSRSRPRTPRVRTGLGQASPSKPTSPPTGSRSPRRSGRSTTSGSSAPARWSARRSASALARPPARSSAARSSPPPRPGLGRGSTHIRLRNAAAGTRRPDLGDLKPEAASPDRSPWPTGNVSPRPLRC